MKRTALIILSLLFISAFAFGCRQQETKQTSEQTGEDIVTISNFEFLPATLTVKQSKTVTWINKDSATHTIKSDLFNSGNLRKGESFQYTFNEKGKFDYTCGIHPSMQGKIIVE